MSLKHAPKEIKREKIRGEEGSPAWVCKIKFVAVELSWEFNMWGEGLSVLTLCGLGENTESQTGLG